MDTHLSQVKKAFFVGIGGIGISAIARMLLAEGKEVYGSDMTESEITRELAALGAHITIGQSFDLIPKDADLIVYTIAINHYAPELAQQIKNSGITAKSYPEMLSIVTAGKYTIAVSGTHGKTTTTAMIAQVLVETKKDPSVIVGSLLKEYKSNLIVGAGEYFVVEACEYERSFLNIHPRVLVITNIEADHLDYYKDLADIEHAFAEMAGQTKSAIVCDPNDVNVASMLTTFSGMYPESKVLIVDYTTYLVQVPQLKTPGEHNRKNAACALAVAEIIGVESTAATTAVSHFAGTWRRLDMRGTSANGAIIYDDYAHHPTEIKASLSGLRELYPKGKNTIVVLFQPHLYSRTKAFFEDFAHAFGEADEVYLLPIFFAREEKDPSISSELLAEKIKEQVPSARAFADFAEAQAFIAGRLSNSNAVFVSMGAGEAYKVGDGLLVL